MPSKFQRQTADGTWTPLHARDFDDAAAKMVEVAKRAGRPLLWGASDPDDETGVLRRTAHYRAWGDGSVGPVDVDAEKAAAETARKQGRQELARGLLRRASYAW